MLTNDEMETYPKAVTMQPVSNLHRIYICVLLILGTGAIQAAVVHVPIQSNLVLQPGEAHTVAIDAAEPTEIGWLAVQPKPCTTNCVEFTELGPGIHVSVATRLGAAKNFKPVSGKIAVEYKNVSNDPVTINIYRVDRTCEAEACRFLNPDQTAHTLVFKIGEFKAITTSQDRSYSVISGITIDGRPFRFKAVWWTDDPKALGVNCANFVKRYLDSHTPKEQYQPYIISGQAVARTPEIILKSVDTCVPKAPHYGVDPRNVY